MRGSKLELYPVFLYKLYMDKTMKDRRIKEEIYLKILTSIQEQTNGDPAKLTKVQLTCGISYDKAKLYAERLEGFGLLTMNPLKLTVKGCAFIKQFRTFFPDFNSMKQKYFNGGESWKDLLLTIPYFPSSKYQNISQEDVKDLYQQINNLKAINEELENKIWK